LIVAGLATKCVPFLETPNPHGFAFLTFKDLIISPSYGIKMGARTLSGTFSA